MPAASASATRSIRISARPLPSAVEPMVPTGLSPARMVAPGFRRRAVEHDAHRSGARGAAMLHPRHHLLADVTALVEIDAVQAVHVGFVRKRVAIDEVEPAARHAGGDAMRVIGGGYRPVPRRSDRRPFARVPRAPESASRARRCADRRRRDRACIGEIAIPGREHAETVRQIFDRDLGAQLVEAELVGERLRQRARAVDQETAAMAGRAPR